MLEVQFENLIQKAKFRPLERTGCMSLFGSLPLSAHAIRVQTGERDRRSDGPGMLEEEETLRRDDKVWTKVGPATAAFIEARAVSG